jgi:Ran GTPase-activating protein (RanGAP) involved in mRNA processing and transport
MRKSKTKNPREVKSVLQAFFDHDPFLRRIKLSDGLLAQDSLLNDAGYLHKFTTTLRHNVTITELDLSRNEVRESGIEAIASALVDNTSIVTLKLYSCKISTNGIISLANMLLYNSTITELDMGSNAITSEGILALSNTLQHNQSLKILSLWLPSYDSNQLSDEEAECLSVCLQCNTSLTTLDIRGHAFSEMGYVKVANSLRENVSLKSLSIRCCTKQEAGSTAMAAALGNNKSLTSLHFEDEICMSGKEMIQILAALKHNYTLTELDFGCLAVVREGDCTYLASVLQNNYCLTSLKLGRRDSYMKIMVEFEDEINLAEPVLSLDQVLRRNKVFAKLNKALQDNHEETDISFQEGGSFKGMMSMATAFHDQQSSIEAEFRAIAEMGYSGFVAPCVAIQQSCATLATLDLSQQNIGFKGGVIIATALCNVDCNLASLKLKCVEWGGLNIVSNEGIWRTRSTFSSANSSTSRVEFNKRLTTCTDHVDVANSRDIESDAASSLHQDGSSNETQGNERTFKVTAAFAKALKVNCTLQSLQLYDNSMDTSDLEYISEALRINVSLKNLNLATDNIIEAKGGLAVASAAQQNYCISFLELDMLISGAHML